MEGQSAFMVGVGQVEAELAGTWAGVLSPLDVVQGSWSAGFVAGGQKQVTRFRGSLVTS